MKCLTQRLVITLAFLTYSAAPAPADTFGSGANTFDIEFVPIGNPNNPADTIGDPNPAGSVGYSYRIGKFEISVQMINKANTEGGLGIGGTRGPDKPATLSWNGAARFVNWLNTSTGSPPAYKFAIQPGEVGYSFNSNIELWTIGDAGYDPNNLYRNSLARYFLPSVDEWYKAAYYDPTDVYFNYPTGSDSAPTPVASGTAAGTAVYFQGTSTGPADITFAGGLSPYGTMGQGGNVWEWQETDYDLVNDSGSSERMFRGGVWQDGFSAGDMASVSRYRLWPFAANLPEANIDDIGFRVASLAESPGDFNHDGMVDAADYVVWRKTGINGPTGYDTWRTNFGALGGTGLGGNANTNVPEPASLVMFVVAAVGVSTRRRWHAWPVSKLNNV